MARAQQELGDRLRYHEVAQKVYAGIYTRYE